MSESTDVPPPTLDRLIVVEQATHEAVSGLVDTLLAIRTGWLPDDGPLLLGKANELRRALRIAVARAEGLQ